MNTRTLLYFVCLLLIHIDLLATPVKTIYQPVYNSTNNDIFLIEKIEITDSTTVLYADFYHIPDNWVSISSFSYLKGSSGKKYKLLGSDNFEPDKKIYLPESGILTATFHFEPLDPAETSFDFIEGEERGDFQISGIQLTPRVLTGRFQCLIRGEVINRPQSNMLYLVKKDEDFRINKILVPIKNGRFEYLMDIEDEQAYELIFKDEVYKGGWNPVHFFSCPGEIRMQLFPQKEFRNNIIEGGEHNKELAEYSKEINSFQEKCYKQAEYVLNTFSDSIIGIKEGYEVELIKLKNLRTTDTKDLDLEAEEEKLWEEDRYYNETAKDLLKKADAALSEDEKRNYYEQFRKLQESNLHKTPEAIAIGEKIAKIESIIGDMELIYMNQNPTLVSYDRLLESIKLSLRSYPVYNRYHGKTGDYLLLYNSVYSKKYPDHPYTREMQQIIDTWSAVKPGGKYIDFTAPDKEGNTYTLSELIDGRIALLDMWASWCGPCRRHSISMIPVYEEFKEKGFTIIGIARETDPQAGIKAMEKDGYPWLNLLEIKDKGEVWKKYGIGNAGGSSFLIDKDGTILAIHPSAEELRIILKNKLEE